MKRMMAIAAGVLVFSSTGMAQILENAPIPPQSNVTTTATSNQSRHAREADARHCLELKENLAIIRCAEKYRRVAAVRADTRPAGAGM